MGNTVTLRRGGPADVAAMRALTREIYAKRVPMIGRDVRPMRADDTEAVDTHRFDLLHAGGRLVALIETIAAANHLTVENLEVAPSFQKRGLGHRLMAHAELLAATLGVDEIRLYTNARFTDNLRFYGRLGYLPDREEAFGGNVIVHLKKRIRREAARTAGSVWPAAAS